MGWNVGMNAGSPLSAALGVAVTMFGILLPSSVLTWFAARWGQRNRDRLGVRAFRQGMAPVVVALLMSTSWILAGAQRAAPAEWPLWLLALASGLLVWRTRIHLLWVLAAGAVLGWLQLV
jgi:chromate transporter